MPALLSLVLVTAAPWRPGVAAGLAAAQATAAADLVAGDEPGPDAQVTGVPEQEPGQPRLRREDDSVTSVPLDRSLFLGRMCTTRLTTVVVHVHRPGDGYESCGVPSI